MTTTPIHTYETVEGTNPAGHAKHEARTTKHTVTTGDDTDLHMMTEIGDGVFVQWSNCRRCNARVASCKCPDGPEEPHYMKPWREKRFGRSLNDRPNPDYDLLDTVLSWVRERGYTVTKKGEKQTIQQLAEEQGVKPVEDLDDLAIPDLTEDERDDMMDALDELHPPHLPPRYLDREVEDVDLPEGVDPEKVDAGLDAALEKVREAKRDLSDIPDEF